MRIVLCCGGRDWNDQEKVDKALLHEHKKHPIDFVIEGGQKTIPQSNWGNDSWRGPHGGDYQAKIAAQKLGIQVIECPANWIKFHRSAGPIRNEKQLKLARELACEGRQISGSEQKMNLLVLAFHSNIKKSSGTKHMVKIAKKSGVKVRIIK